MAGARGRVTAAHDGGGDAAGELVVRSSCTRRRVRGGAVERAGRGPWRARGDRAAGGARLRAGAARVPAAGRGRGAGRSAPVGGRARDDRGGMRGAGGGAARRGARPIRVRAAVGVDGAAARREPPRPRRDSGDHPHLRHDLGAAPGGADVREPPVERARLGGGAGRGSTRALAVRAAAVARGRPVDPAALGDLRDHGGGARALRDGPRAARAAR